MEKKMRTIEKSTVMPKFDFLSISSKLRNRDLFGKERMYFIEYRTKVENNVTRSSTDPREEQKELETALVLKKAID